MEPKSEPCVGKVAMSTILSTLYQVQIYELEIDQARDRIETIESLLAHDNRIAAAQTRLNEVQDILQGARARLKDLELEIASLAEKISEVNELVYGGKIKNPREIQDRQNELDSLQRRHAHLAGLITEAKQDVDNCAAEVAAAEENMAKAQNTNVEMTQELIKERESLDDAIKATLKKRKKIVADVPDSTLKHYRALRKIKSGQAIAILKGDSCGVCGIEQPSSEVNRVTMRSDEIIHCIGCGRILIAP